MIIYIYANTRLSHTHSCTALLYLQLMSKGGGFFFTLTLFTAALFFLDRRHTKSFLSGAIISRCQYTECSIQCCSWYVTGLPISKEEFNPESSESWLLKLYLLHWAKFCQTIPVTRQHIYHGGFFLQRLFPEC